MSEEVVFRIENLNVWYGEKHVLRNISMEIKDKMVTAIVGPSGCGKSTFIRCLNRMNDHIPDFKLEGKIAFRGKDIYSRDIKVENLRQRVGMVFQKPNPFPKSIYENVAFGLKLKGIKSRDMIDAKVEEALRKAALWDEVKDRLHSSALDLSGGQQQRLCIARAIAVEPEVILFDEPCSALDPIATARIEELMVSLKEKYAIVVVTHNLQQAARISDHTAFLYMGELIEYGPTDKMFTVPQKKLTEEYLRGKFG